MIEVGSVVQLKSGGPVMTVTSVDQGVAKCLWYEENLVAPQWHNMELPIPALTVVPERLGLSAADR